MIATLYSTGAVTVLMDGQGSGSTGEQELGERAADGRSFRGATALVITPGISGAPERADESANEGTNAGRLERMLHLLAMRHALRVMTLLVL